MTEHEDTRETLPGGKEKRRRGRKAGNSHVGCAAISDGPAGGIAISRLAAVEESISEVVVTREGTAMKQRGIFEKEPGSGVWWIRYADATGRIRREKVGPKSAAVMLYRKRKTEILQGKKLPETLRRRTISFLELAQDALSYSRTHKRSHDDDRSRMERILSWFRGRSADSITADEIEGRLARAEEENAWTPATVNRYRALLSLIYRLGIRNGKVTANPARLVRHRQENNTVVRYLTPEEEVRLRDVIHRQYSEHLPEFEIALNTGLRLSELYTMTWENVDLSRRILTVPRSKNGELRHVPLNRPVVNALQALRKLSDGTGPVFRNCRNMRLTSPRYWFEAAVKAAKVPDFTWHCLRHTFASRLVMNGEDLRTVQELMGHKTISMTVRYSHLAPQQQLAAVDRLAAAGRRALQDLLKRNRSAKPLLVAWAPETQAS
jgi:integrase